MEPTKYLISNNRIIFSALVSFGSNVEEMNTFYPHPNIVNGLRFTPLGYFCMQGKIKKVKLCLQKGADPNLGTLWYEDGIITSVQHPLFRAAGTGKNSFDIVMELLKFGAKYDENLITEMLEECVWNINFQLIEWMFQVSPKLDPNYRNHLNCPTIFLTFCMRWDTTRNQEQIDVARLLIQKGADLKIKYVLPCSRVSDWEGHLKSSLFYLSNDQKNEILNKILAP